MLTTYVKCRTRQWQEVVLLMQYWSWFGTSNVQHGCDNIDAEDDATRQWQLVLMLYWCWRRTSTRQVAKGLISKPSQSDGWDRSPGIRDRSQMKRTRGWEGLQPMAGIDPQGSGIDPKMKTDTRLGRFASNALGSIRKWKRKRGSVIVSTNYHCRVTHLTYAISMNIALTLTVIAGCVTSLPTSILSQLCCAFDVRHQHQ